MNDCVGDVLVDCFLEKQRGVKLDGKVVSRLLAIVEAIQAVAPATGGEDSLPELFGEDVLQQLFWDATGFEQIQPQRNLTFRCCFKSLVDLALGHQLLSDDDLTKACALKTRRGVNEVSILKKDINRIPSLPNVDTSGLLGGVETTE